MKLWKTVYSVAQVDDCRSFYHKWYRLRSTRWKLSQQFGNNLPIIAVNMISLPSLTGSEFSTINSKQDSSWRENDFQPSFRRMFNLTRFISFAIAIAIALPLSLSVSLYYDINSFIRLLIIVFSSFSESFLLFSSVSGSKSRKVSLEVKEMTSGQKGYIIIAQDIVSHSSSDS